MRGDLGLEKTIYRRHARALKYAGRVRAMSAKRWPKIVGESLLEHIAGRGTWADYVSLLMERYRLISKWKEVGWTKKEWDKTVTMATKEAGEQSWARDVAGREDLGNMEENKRVAFSGIHENGNRKLYKGTNQRENRVRKTLGLNVGVPRRHAGFWCPL